MDPYNKMAIVILFMLFVNSYSAVMSFGEGENPAESLSKVMNQRNKRGLIMLEAVSDYDKPGPNPKHDQGKGKPGPGGGGTSNP
ncbi:uncharacterized protein LOC115740881 isoform X2 [Rhodamnia argentea]|uniref:Uncharacterized protein LOC115740881 isoform X2 n=1 Tax=Rhodamnia argentea TaxID=178133 RepID=A0A8B8P6K6_9MYRT|nr:uncharacterized protein LOC115740881 isoform X2 [Rhodamnia argentea]